MKLQFKPEDFAVAWCEPETSNCEMDVELAKACAKVANAKLQEWLEIQDVEVEE